MDGEAFDRLSVVVHQLRDKATRRGAFGFILGGSLVAVGSVIASDTEAKNKRKKNKNKKYRNCRGSGWSCNSHGDCCNSRCFDGRCWGSGGGHRCGGRFCDNGWGCCSSGGVSVCVPHNYPTCCGNQGFTNGYFCCGDFGGACLGGLEACTGQFGICCQPGWRHCNNGFTSTCIPNSWDCNQFFYQSSQNAGVASESEQIPTSDPIAIPSEDWIDLQ